MKRNFLVLVVIGIIVVLSLFLISCKNDTFTVTLTETAGVNYDGFDKLSIKKGGEVKFSITLDEAYNNSTIIVKVNGVEITAVDGIYTISNITEVQTVTVEGVVADTYTIALTETHGVTYSEYQNLTIAEGEAFNFTVLLDQAYNNSQITVKANGAVISAVGGVYTIPEIKEDKIITVEGITNDTYTVSLTEIGGITYGGYQSLTVIEGDAFSFTATLSQAYDNSQITVKANGIALTAANGIYTIFDIK